MDLKSIKSAILQEIIDAMDEKMVGGLKVHSPRFMKISEDRREDSPKFQSVNEDRGEHSPKFMKVDEDRGEHSPKFAKVEVESDDPQLAEQLKAGMMKSISPKGDDELKEEIDEESLKKLLEMYKHL